MRHVNYVSAKLKNNILRLTMAFVVGDKHSVIYQHPWNCGKVIWRPAKFYILHDFLQRYGEKESREGKEAGWEEGRKKLRDVNLAEKLGQEGKAVSICLLLCNKWPPNLVAYNNHHVIIFHNFVNLEFRSAQWREAQWHQPGGIQTGMV